MSASEAFRTLVLNPASAFIVAVAAAGLHASGTPVLWLLNPWGLTIFEWVAGYAAVRFALLGFVDGFVWLLAPRLPALPSRTGPKPVYQHALNVVDITYLAVNSAVEFVFTLQILHLLWHAPFIARVPGDFGLLNGPVALWLLLVFDDMLYAPMHRFMHHPAVYRYVHKHHHRNTYPARGYIDAANEHPVEQIAALSIHWTAVHMVAYTSGLHVLAVGAHFGFKALGACFNHTGYDVQIRLPGIHYSVRSHEMHHRKPNTNYAQYVMFWDQLMGTFVDYDSGLEQAPKGAAAEPEPGRLPAWADPAVEARTGRVVNAEKAE